VVAYKTAAADATAPAAPVLSGTPFHQRNELSWTAVTDPSAPVIYKLLRDNVEIYSGTNLSYSDTGRTNGVAYVYKVRAVDAWSNTSADSNTQTLTPVGDVTAPAAPVLTGTVGTGQNDLSWTAVTDPTPTISYQLYRGVTLVYNGANTTFADVGQGAGVTYTVKASDGVPNQSVASNAVTVVASTVSAAVIGRSDGVGAGVIRQGGGYYVFANFTTGSTTVTANVSNVTSGQTAVTFTAGSYTAGGVSYGYRTALLTAANPLSEGSKAFTVTPSGGTTFNGSVTVDNTAFAGSDIQNPSAGITGKPETGDTIVYTFSATDISTNSILAGWTGASTNVTVEIFQNGSSDDTITVWNSAYNAQLPLGSVDTNADPVSSTAVFSNSTMVLSGSTITITLGTLTSGAVRTDNKTPAMVWTPSASLTDLAGNPMSTAPVTESGALDIGF
jgi:hypothetical protein